LFFCLLTFYHSTFTRERDNIAWASCLQVKSTVTPFPLYLANQALLGRAPLALEHPPPSPCTDLDLDLDSDTADYQEDSTTSSVSPESDFLIITTTYDSQLSSNQVKPYPVSVDSEVLHEWTEERRIFAESAPEPMDPNALLDLVCATLLLTTFLTYKLVIHALYQWKKTFR
jgi:hypothetical protein